MGLRWYSTVVDAVDHHSLAHWWAEALGWQVWVDSELEAVVVPPWAGELVGQLPFERVPPGMVFVPTGVTKSGKNRLHWDFAPQSDDERAAEIERLVGLGASVIDVGQPADATWTVLADPEGNEFCVLSARDA
ncbi:VOC family protein [Zhihengliuella alba]|uniref:VOC family protein n=1 Tax=Zhihengliuella alba TaxID=547018 RepID=A0ABP7CK08_9MICC